MDNIILMTDSYKVSHWKQYPPNTEKIYSYFESRGGKYENVVFFGLQYILKKYLVGHNIVNTEKINQAEEFFSAHFGDKSVFNREGWEYIYRTYGGRLPIEIKSIPEGTVVPVQNVLFTVENTDPNCFWLTSYLETLLEQVWYPCTIATQSHYMKKTIEKSLKQTGDDAPDFKLHDFGYRGSSSQESAGIGDAAHLLSFMGTDTIAGIRLLQDYYRATMPGFSIPAAEHSTITSWGKEEEVFAFANILQEFPKGLVAVVSDSYDIYNACENIWGEELHDRVEGRDGTLVIRPDSGDPNVVLLKVLDILGRKFGYTENSKGYKVLPKFIRIIQGDGIDEESLDSILTHLKVAGWSTDNIAFGSGGGLLQKANRDTMRFAYKCSSITVGGEEREVSKAPVTDPNKFSKKGRLALVKTENGYKTVTAPALIDSLKTVFKDGYLLSDQSFDEVKGRANER